MPDFERYSQLGLKAVREAGKLLMERFGTDFIVSHKGDINLVTEVDFAAEDLIVSRLKAAFPDHTILAEEYHAGAPRGPITWIIDPLDGTTNYARRFPFFAVSIGLEIEGELEWGAVYNPVLEETFTCRRGQGSFLNGKPIHVSRIDSLDRSFLATGFPYDIRSSQENNLDYFREFALRALAIRRVGSAAQDFCYLAAGRFDGFWEIKLHPWDCAAGYLLVREAGGTVTDFNGRKGSIYDREFIASNSLIHGQMLEVISELASLAIPEGER